MGYSPETVTRLENELQELCKELGGGWRIENGYMPMIVLTLEEARKLSDKIGKK
jgi:hypothetical protein